MFFFSSLLSSSFFFFFSLSLQGRLRAVRSPPSWTYWGRVHWRIYRCPYWFARYVRVRTCLCVYGCMCVWLCLWLCVCDIEGVRVCLCDSKEKWMTRKILDRTESMCVWWAWYDIMGVKNTWRMCARIFYFNFIKSFLFTCFTSHFIYVFLFIFIRFYTIWFSQKEAETARGETVRTLPEEIP